MDDRQRLRLRDRSIVVKFKFALVHDFGRVEMFAFVTAFLVVQTSAGLLFDADEVSGGVGLRRWNLPKVALAGNVAGSGCEDQTAFFARRHSINSIGYVPT